MRDLLRPVFVLRFFPVIVLFGARKGNQVQDPDAGLIPSRIPCLTGVKTRNQGRHSSLKRKTCTVSDFQSQTCLVSLTSLCLFLHLRCFPFGPALTSQVTSQVIPFYTRIFGNSSPPHHHQVYLLSVSCIPFEQLLLKCLSSIVTHQTTYPTLLPIIMTACVDQPFIDYTCCIP